ncbi:MAG: hypothetical protein PUK81_01975, partial [Firmicutes bacterium]|nr:hypothetical protein [Bacillota bacterium]
ESAWQLRPNAPHPRLVILSQKRRISCTRVRHGTLVREILRLRLADDKWGDGLFQTVPQGHHIIDYFCYASIFLL